MVLADELDELSFVSIYHQSMHETYRLASPSPLIRHQHSFWRSQNLNPRSVYVHKYRYSFYGSCVCFLFLLENSPSGFSKLLFELHLSMDKHCYLAYARKWGENLCNYISASFSRWLSELGGNLHSIRSLVQCRVCTSVGVLCVCVCLYGPLV